MKNNLKYFIIALFTFSIFTSCEEEITVYEGPTPFVQIENDAATSIGELGGEETITLSLVAYSDSRLTVDFTVEADDTSRFTISPSSGSVTFGEGEYEKTIVVSSIDNSVADGNSTLTVTISGASAGTAAEGTFKISKTITIVDDDCPVLIDETTNWEAQYDWTSSTRGLIPSEVVQLQKLADNVYYCPTTWGFNGVSFITNNPAYDGRFAFDVIIELNPADNTIQVTGNGTWGLGGTGYYDPCANQFVVPVLDDQLFSGGGIDSSWTLTGL